MTAEDLAARFGIPLATFLVALASGFLPFINVEIYLAAVAAFSSAIAVLPVLLMATAGQMAAKVSLYLAGQGALRLSSRYEAKVDEYRDRFDAWRGRTDLLLFMSASLGLPPFYVVSIVAGMFHVGLGRFVLWGSIGRFLRFLVVFLVPRLIRGYWG